MLGELALGVLTPRAEVLESLDQLDEARVAEHEEVLTLVHRAPLWGRGIGWVDARSIGCVPGRSTCRLRGWPATWASPYRTDE